MHINPRIFREYDIRGTANVDLDADLARLLGIAFARSVLEERFAPLSRTADGRAVVAVGHDTRLTSPEFAGALIEGLRIGGVDVLFGGLGPTPQLYYLRHKFNCAGGIVVTGSHNPRDDNGFKLVAGDKTLSGADIQELKQRIIELAQCADQPAKLLGAVNEVDARALYVAGLVSLSRPHINAARRIKVVVDSGNGVAGLAGPQVLRQLGCEVIELYSAPDGRFPNHHPDPSMPENIAELRRRVVSDHADLGIAWDGDGDRIGVVDENAAVIYGDMLVVIYGRQILKEVANPLIIGDVKCSDRMFSDLEHRGARVLMWKTGHSLIKTKMKELAADLGGEMCGHIFFGHRFFGFDDAIYAAARLIEIVSHATGPVSSLLADLPPACATPELKVACSDELKFAVARQAQLQFPEYETDTTDGVRIKFPQGWGLVRASNTGPVLILRFEAQTPELLAAYRSLVETRIAALIAKLSSSQAPA